MVYTSQGFKLKAVQLLTNQQKRYILCYHNSFAHYNDKIFNLFVQQKIVSNPLLYHISFQLYFHWYVNDI